MGKKSSKRPANTLTSAQKKELQKKKDRNLTIALVGVAALLLLLVCILIFGGKGKKEHKIEIEVENYGVIRAVVDSSVAPKTVENFLKLVKSGFYDGLTFHRIVDGFMIQCGDPTGTGSGGSKDYVQGEFSANGFENTLSHKRGVLSMARSKDYNSARSQFFIVQSDSFFLDGNYAAFGWVTDGMEIVDEICKNTPVENKNGTVLAENQPVITAIRVLN